MKVKLYNEPTKGWSGTTQVLCNRGLELEDVKHYLNTTDEDINDPCLLGVDNLRAAAKLLVNAINNEDKVLVVVDADNDGYTSAAILINYLYDVFPAFVLNNLNWYLHTGKQHGLNDCIDIAEKYKLVILPDAGSNDVAEVNRLAALGIPVFCLDHHEVDVDNPNMVIVNNQNSNYPNKEFSGAGVTWQFCRFLDSLLNKDFAKDYLDLVALGNMGDVMSMQSFETKHLILKGFKEENIKNPFIHGMISKNEFSLNKSDYKPSLESGLKVSPIGAAFFIVPFVNAIVRSGTQEEKELIFSSMLKFKAFEEVMSTKRGHKLGETERILDQALRTCTNVKNRQTRAIDAGMEMLEKRIEANNMMQNKVLLFLLEPGEIDRNIAGLCANKLMGKYQRPCCILTRVDNNGLISYQGSARGYGDMDFKAVCGNANAMFATGHANAFGLGLDLSSDANAINNFIAKTNEEFKTLSSEPSYFVDYSWNCNEIDGEKIIELAEINDYIGKDIDRPYVYIKGIQVNTDTFKVMKSNTLKYIPSPSKVDIIQFGGTDEEIERFSQGTTTINAVCKCLINEFNYQRLPQLVMVDYEIVENKKETLLDIWGF